MNRICAAVLGSALLIVAIPAPYACATDTPRADTPADAKREPTPKERMNRRYPQPVRVGDLIGLPLLDYDDRTMGYVRSVVRTPDGNIKLIATQGGWPTGWFSWRARLVPVPIEVVAILGRQINVLDMTWEEFAAAPTWMNTGGMTIPPDETIRIAITSR